MSSYLIGWALAMTASTAWLAYLLAKKPTTINEIDNLKQKNKRNKGSSIDNNINANLAPVDKRKPHKRRLKRK